MKYTVFIISFLILFVTSCDLENTDNKNIVYNEFTNAINLTNPDSIKLHTIINPDKIFVVDSLFLITSYQGTEYFFYTFDSNFVEIGRFGRKGHGANEFTMAETNGQYSIENGRIKLWIWDQNEFKAFKIDLLNAISKKKKNFIEKIIYLPVETLTIPQLLICEEEKVVFGRSDMVSKGMLFFFRINENNINWTGRIENIDQFAVPENLDLAYHSYLACDNINKRVITAMTFFEQINIFNTNGTIYKTIVINNDNEKPNLLSVENPFPKENINYYMDLKVSNKYIYASLSGLSYEEKNNINKLNKSQTGKIQVFDLEGNPVIEYSFNHTVSKFTVDKNDKYIYIINYSDERIPIYRYKLLKLKK